MTFPRSAGAALVLLFLAAHLAWLPRTLEDLDSINFALGVRQFDVAHHQPHPPGYPVFIALAKLSTGALRAIGAGAAGARGLAIWSALGGALAIPAVLVFLRRLEGRDRLAWWATLTAAASPLFWFTALRPLSDMLGFAAAMAVLALAAGNSTGRRLIVASLAAGLAIGIRSQTAVLTLPLLSLSLLRRRDGGIVIASLAAFAAGVLAWGIPLIVASGGPSGYLHALTFQAEADFSGVVMLWTHRTVRVAAGAAANTFIWPWDWRLGIAVCALAAAGLIRIAWRSPRVIGVLLVTFGPYAIFHLFFHETKTVRYALPLIPIVAYAAMAAVEGLPARTLQAAALGISAISLLQAVPASAVYARDGAPVFRAFDDMAATFHGGDPVEAIGFHAGVRRPAEWAAHILPARVVQAPHGREWIPLVALWRAQPSARVWFVADPQRTDLALFDARARDLARAYRWGFEEPPCVGGARPGDVDWYRMAPPGWMLDRGWSVSAEIGGVTKADGFGPHLAPAIAWLRRQPDPVTVLIGGRDIGPAPATLTAALNGSRVASYPLKQGFFLQRLEIPAGASSGPAGYQSLELASDRGGPVVSLEQFDAQPPGVPMVGYDAGWQEPEYNPSLGRSWRWMSERADLWVRPIGRPVTLRFSGESPLRYFKRAPHVRVLAGDRELFAFDPASDFEQTIALPADLLERAGGRVTLESSQFFVPARSGAADQRRLALRIYQLTVD